MTDVEWTAADESRYWQDVFAERDWWFALIHREFDRIKHGSGDALMDLCRLRERIEKESIEGVAWSNDAENHPED